MPEKTFWTLLRKSWIASFQGPRFQPHQSVPKVLTCVGHFHLTKGDEMSVHFRNSWMDFDICCFELASLDVLISADSRFKPVGGEIWYPSPQWERCSQKAPYCLTRKNVIFSASEKMTFFRAEKMAFFRTPKRTSWTTQKAQCKNITRKRKHDEKYIRENSPKKSLFWEFCFAPALARPKKHNYFAQNRFPKISLFFRRPRPKKRQKFDPLRDGWDAMIKICIRGKEKCLREKSQKKFVFLGFFEIETAQTWLSQAIRNLEEIY